MDANQWLIHAENMHFSSYRLTSGICQSSYLWNLSSVLVAMNLHRSWGLCRSIIWLESIEWIVIYKWYFSEYDKHHLRGHDGWDDLAGKGSVAPYVWYRLLCHGTFHGRQREITQSGKGKLVYHHSCVLLQLGCIKINRKVPYMKQHEQLKLFYNL